MRDCLEYATFTTPDPVKLPVPSPTYLAIHAACAKATHLSGASECIDKLYRDMEDGTTLDPNGASAEVLEHAIFELQASGYEVTVWVPYLNTIQGIFSLVPKTTFNQVRALSVICTGGILFVCSFHHFLA